MPMCAARRSSGRLDAYEPAVGPGKAPEHRVTLESNESNFLSLSPPTAPFPSPCPKRIGKIEKIGDGVVLVAFGVGFIWGSIPNNGATD